MSRPYRTCPACGDHLDPGEVCDCKRGTEAAQTAGEYADQPTTANPLEPVLIPGA